MSGGEVLELENLSPAGRERIVLPTAVPVARFSYTDGREVEVALNLDGVHLDFCGETRRMDLTWRGRIDSCPSFYRADLKLMTRAETEEAKLPLVCEEGLRERG